MLSNIEWRQLVQNTHHQSVSGGQTEKAVH